jgi:hypothetical protein
MMPVAQVSSGKIACLHLIPLTIRLNRSVCSNINSGCPVPGMFQLYSQLHS